MSPLVKNLFVTVKVLRSRAGNLLIGISRQTFQPNTRIANFNDMNPELRVD
jgi:hypothetical protein